MDIADLLIKHEDLRLKPYRDSVGKLTIGVGRNLDDRGLSKDECLYLMWNDIKIVSKELAVALPWLHNLDQVRQAVVIDMAFNLGVPKFLQFKNTIRWIELTQWDKAAEEMLNSNWAKQVGNRALELAEMMRSGEWPI
jgi:lysozyme